MIIFGVEYPFNIEAESTETRGELSHLETNIKLWTGETVLKHG